MVASARNYRVSNADKAHLQTLLTPGRLDRYRSWTPAKTLGQALQLYRWNTEISAALYADIAVVEVATRNAIDSALRKLHNRDHWYLHPTTDAYIASLGKRGRKGLDQAHRWLGNARPLASYPAGKVVAELTFGFWVGLLDAGDVTTSGTRLDYGTTFWLPTGQHGAGIRFAFAGLAQPSRRTVHRAVSLLVETRNRIAHHEPIIGGVRRKGGAATDPPITLLAIHQTILDLGRWLSPAVHRWVDQTSTFDVVHSNRPAW
jgi:hypothetical protein